MMKLSVFAIGLGLAVAMSGVYALFKPAMFAQAMKKFPRSMGWGYILMGLSTAWFLYYFQDESISDFAIYKPYMIGGFVLLAILTCVYVRDFLAVRGLALCLFLLAKLMLDTARWQESSWRLVIVVWAYVMIVAGVWLTLAPWGLRDWLAWITANETRTRIWAGLRLALGLLVLLLGLAVF